MLFCYCFMNSVLLKIAIIALLIAFAIDCYYPILHLNAEFSPYCSPRSSPRSSLESSPVQSPAFTLTGGGGGGGGVRTPCAPPLDSALDIIAACMRRGCVTRVNILTVHTHHAHTSFI